MIELKNIIHNFMIYLGEPLFSLNGCGGATAEEEVVEEETETTAAPATTAAAAEEAAPSGPDGVFKMAIFGKPQTNNIWNYLDTENDFWTGVVMTKQSVSLFTLSKPNNTLIPEMAAELVETSVDNGDGTFTYTVPIREGYEWSDGNPITANDWFFTFETTKSLSLNIGWSWDIADDDGNRSKGVTSVEAVDDYTVSVTFNYDPGLAGWQYGIGQAPAMPRHYWEQYATDKETLLAYDAIVAPVAGPFVYDKLEDGAFYTWLYDANTMWFGEEITIYDAGGVSIKWDNGVAPAFSGKFGNTTGDSFTYTKGPYVGTVEFTLYSDQDAAYLAFQNGEVDLVLNPLGVKRNLFNQLSTIPDVELVQNMELGSRYMSFNTRQFPGSNKAFRQAVACIIDREFVINSVLQGTVERMDGQISGALTAWAPPLSGSLAECQNLDTVGKWEKSIQILQDAGWTADDWGSHPGNDTRAIPPTGIKGPNGEVPPSDMLIYAPGPGYDPLRNTFSLFIADYIRQLGFDVTARPTGFSVIIDTVFNPENVKDWHFYILGQGHDIYPDHLVYNFGSQHLVEDGGWNSSGYNNSEYDALTGQFLAAKTVDEAISLSNQMEAILFEDLPWLSLFSPPILDIYRGDSVEFPFTDVLGGLSNLDTTLLTSIVKMKDGNTSSLKTNLKRNLLKMKNVEVNDRETSSYDKLIKKKSSEAIVNVYKKNGQWINCHYQNYYPASWFNNYVENLQKLYIGSTINEIHSIDVNKYTTLYFIKEVGNPFYFIECKHIENNSVELKETGIRQTHNYLLQTKTAITTIIRTLNPISYLSLTIQNIIADLTTCLNFLNIQINEFEIILNTPLSLETNDEYKYSNYQKLLHEENKVIREIMTKTIIDDKYDKIFYNTFYRKPESIWYDSVKEKYISKPSHTLPSWYDNSSENNDYEEDMEDFYFTDTNYKQSIYIKNKNTSLNSNYLENTDDKLLAKVFILPESKIAKINNNVNEVSLLLEKILGDGSSNGTLQSILSIPGTGLADKKFSFLGKEYSIDATIDLMSDNISLIKNGITVLDDYDKEIARGNEFAENSKVISHSKVSSLIKVEPSNQKSTNIFQLNNKKKMKMKFN